MFDYIKKMKQQLDKKEDEPKYKPKRDKVFIGILIVFSAMIVIGFVTGIGDIKGAEEMQNMNYSFKFSVVDGVILGGGILAYLFIRFRKGRK